MILSASLPRCFAFPFGAAARLAAVAVAKDPAPELAAPLWEALETEDTFEARVRELDALAALYGAHPPARPDPDAVARATAVLEGEVHPRVAVAATAILEALEAPAPTVVPVAWHSSRETSLGLRQTLRRPPR